MTSFPLLEIEKGQEFWEKEGSSGEKYKGGWLLQEKRKIVSSDAEKFLASVCTRTLVNTFFPFSRTQPGYYIHPDVWVWRWYLKLIFLNSIRACKFAIYWAHSGKTVAFYHKLNFKVANFEPMTSQKSSCEYQFKKSAVK